MKFAKKNYNPASSSTLKYEKAINLGRDFIILAICLAELISNSNIV